MKPARLKDVVACSHTERGFERIAFRDRYDEPGSLQQSSLADLEQPGASAVWLGTDKDRMHLDREDVTTLIGLLKRWLNTGSFFNAGQG